MPTRSLAKASFALVVGGLCASGTASAQQTMNPPGFDPYSSPYRAYAFPGAGDNPAITNSQMSARPLTTTNNFGRLSGMDDGFGDSDLDPLGGGSRYQRYDSAYRRYDKALGREFTANGKADATYLADRQVREELKLKLLRETDPERRASIKQQLDRTAERPDRVGEDGVDPWVSVRRGRGGPAASSTIAGPAPGRASAARSAPAAGVGSDALARSRPSAVASSGATGGASSSLDRLLDAAPSPSSVLERSRRMNAASSTTKPPASSTPAPR